MMTSETEVMEDEQNNAARCLVSLQLQSNARS